MALIGAMPKTGLLKKATRYQQKQNPVPPQACVSQMIYCIMIKCTSHSETADCKTGHYTQDSSFDAASEWRGCFLPAVERKHWQHEQILKTSPHPTKLQHVTMQHLEQIIKMVDYFKLACNLYSSKEADWWKSFLLRVCNVAGGLYLLLRQNQWCLVGGRAAELGD